MPVITKVGTDFVCGHGQNRERHISRISQPYIRSVVCVALLFPPAGLALADVRIGVKCFMCFTLSNIGVHERGPVRRRSVFINTLYLIPRACFIFCGVFDSCTPSAALANSLWYVYLRVCAIQCLADPSTAYYIPVYVWCRRRLALLLRRFSPQTWQEPLHACGHLS